MNRSFYVRTLVLYIAAACACVHYVPTTPRAPAPSAASAPAPSSSATPPSAPATGTQRPYRILVTNDDGVRAPGILALAQALQSLGEITIAAPSENQSGKGHSIVTSDPIFVDQVMLTGGLRGFSIIATPAT